MNADPSATSARVPALKVRSLRARPLVLKLERPIVARIATITDWPLILIDLETEEGVVGRSYLEPYSVKAMKYLIPALHDLGSMLEGQSLSPVDLYALARKSLHFVGYQGMSMIVVAGLDMAAWDALAKAAGLPLCVLLGGSVGTVAAYNSNGLWLKEPAAVAAEAVELCDEGGFTALKLRLGRERPRDDLATIAAVRDSVGEDVHLMIDFNQGLNLAEALARCHALDDLGLDWIEEPLVYDDLDGHAQLAAELRTPIQIGENFYGPRDLYRALQRKACDLRDRGNRRRAGVDAPLSRGRRARDARHRDRALARVAGLGRSDPAAAVRDQGRPPAGPGDAGRRPRVERGRGRGVPGRLIRRGGGTPLPRLIDAQLRRAHGTLSSESGR